MTKINLRTNILFLFEKEGYVENRTTTITSLLLIKEGYVENRTTTITSLLLIKEGYVENRTTTITSLLLIKEGYVVNRTTTLTSLLLIKEGYVENRTTTITSLLLIKEGYEENRTTTITSLLLWLSVRLYQKKVWTTESIGPKFCVWSHMNLRQVWEFSKLQKLCIQKFLNFVKFWNPRKKILSKDVNIKSASSLFSVFYKITVQNCR